jgi:uncharacterized protein YceH (UPF0502 family)
LTVELPLDAVEKRVLGSLLEKEITTPDYYPLTVNALLAACNQKSNREPVMELDEAAVREALDRLEAKGLVAPARADGRVARFEHRLNEALNLGRRETALLCTLLLRGAQTPGELRGRSERMQRMEDLQEVLMVLQHLVEHIPPLARLLPRQPGTKELRYADALGAQEAQTLVVETAFAAPSPGAGDDRIAALEREVSELREQLSCMRAELDAFRRQFEG